MTGCDPCHCCDCITHRLIGYEKALALIAADKRPDGTFNRDRAACRDLAVAALNAPMTAEQEARSDG